MLFLRKKKLDPNNIPVYKISFENAFSIEKRSPWRNRWEKFRAFKQILLTCLSNSKGFARDAFRIEKPSQGFFVGRLGLSCGVTQRSWVVFGVLCCFFGIGRCNKRRITSFSQASFLNNALLILIFVMEVTTA